MITKERGELVFSNDDYDELVDFPEKGEDDNIPEGRAEDVENMVGSNAELGDGLTDSELKQEDFDNELYLQELEGKDPSLAAALRKNRRFKKTKGLPSGDINDQD